MFALGGHALLGGIAVERDDVGIVSISESSTVAVPPAEQFDRSLRRVWRDKNKVELILRMTTVARQRNDDEGATQQPLRKSTAQAFAQSVFTESRLGEWRRVVQERHWKSICVMHQEIEAEDDQGVGNAIHAAAVAAVDAAGAILAAHDTSIQEINDVGNGGAVDDLQVFHELLQPIQPPALVMAADTLAPAAAAYPISPEEEERMWRGLIEPCKKHTPRLEIRGELTEMQAQVIASIFRPSSGKAATGSSNSSRASKLRVLSIMDVAFPHSVAASLGEAIHKHPDSYLRELSLCKCSMRPGGWDLLLGRNFSQQQSISEFTDEDMDAGGQLMEDSIAAVKMEVEDDDDSSVDSTCDRKPSASAALAQTTGALASSLSLLTPSSPCQTLPLRALYLSDCRLTKADVEETLSSLKSRHPQLETLYLNGHQNFTPEEVDPLVLSYLQTHVNVERLRMPSGDRTSNSNLHSPQIQVCIDLNRCGRRFLHARRDADTGVGPPAPMSLWPLVLERISRVRGLTQSCRANAIYYFVQELHGIATANGSGGTRPPKNFGWRKGGDQALRKTKFALGTSKSSSLTASTASVSSDTGSGGSDSRDNSQQFSLPTPM
jgi:hypothetical protein